MSIESNSNSQESLLRNLDVRNRRPSPDRDSRTAEEMLDDSLDRVWAWVKKFILLLGLLGAVFVALVAILLVAWRWFVHGLSLVKASVFDHAFDLYRWLDEFSPSETEAERSLKFSTLRERIMHMLDLGSVVSWVSYVVPSDTKDLLLLLVVGAVGAVGLFISARYAAQSGTRLVRRMRGVQLEAMRPGSLFTAAEIPACQVQICIPGLFSDLHQGYGVRCGSYLVTPKHVIGSYPEIVLKGPTGVKIQLAPRTTSSRLIEDLVYIRIDTTIFSRLGVQVAKGVQKGFASAFATCIGPLGASTGRVSRATLRGRLNYEGSTLPGMSGAAYLVQGTLVGIHQAAAGVFNLGISAEVIRAEISRLDKVLESVHGPSDPDPKDDASFDPASHRTRGDVWLQREIEEMADERYRDDSWTRDDVEEDFWNRTLKFDDEAARPKKVKAVYIESEGALKKVPINLQNPDSVGTCIDAVPVVLLDYLQELRNGNVLSRLQALEDAVGKLQVPTEAPKRAEKPKEPAVVSEADVVCRHCGVVCVSVEKLTKHIQNSHTDNRVKCPQCETRCRTEARLQNHIVTFHGVVGESAIAEDTGVSGRVVAQQGSFLGRPPLPKRKAKNSMSTSNPSAGKRKSPSMEELLFAIHESQKATQESLRGLAQALAGRSSDITQK